MTPCYSWKFDLGDTFSDGVGGRRGRITGTNSRFDNSNGVWYHTYQVRMDGDIADDNVLAEYAEKNYLLVATIRAPASIEFIPLDFTIKGSDECKCKTLLNGHEDGCLYPKSV